MTGQRQVLLLAHTGRERAIRAARRVSGRLAAAGVGIRVLAEEAEALGLPDARVVGGDAGAAEGAFLVLVLGGDGTLLRAAEFARSTGTPLLGVNLGHVGFLAEAEAEDLDTTVDRVLAGDYHVEQRMTLEARVVADGAVLASAHALNEAVVERGNRSRMLECLLEVDGRPLSRWGCDGVVCATPTGSTAYAFSAGGPVVWPQVQALLVVPISAHALFSRPLVVGPDTCLALEVLSSDPAELSCDGRRVASIPSGGRVEVVRSDRAVPLVRLVDSPFADRLVAKFSLPVQGWRGRGGAEGWH